MSDLQSVSFHSEGVNICGLAPRKRIARIHYMVCDHCKTRRKIIRVFSGSGWYGDSLHCLTCGEDLTTLYHPFERGWRKRAVHQAKGFLPFVVLADEFHRRTMASIRDEMGWDA